MLVILMLLSRNVETAGRFHSLTHSFLSVRSSHDLQGSGVTEDCCSKCFLENQKKLGCQPVQKKREEPPAPEPVEEVQPMEVELTVEALESSPVAPVLKKKKKKTSYKAMMAAMTNTDAPRDMEKEKESIRKATGGGTFSKIDKI